MLDTTTRQLINNRYRLEAKLGTGGMGIVFRAYDRLLGQTVALKQVTSGHDLILDSSHGEIDFWLALAYEFKTLASLRHPNIISVLDYGFDAERQPYFTMDYLENAVPFRDAAAGQPPIHQVNLLIQVLEALSYLHRRGIMHRDLKPGNVLVVDGQVKVLDFGLSSAKGETGSAGTMAYMAPEYFQEHPITEPADLYAVGIMAYEIFVGQHPFNAQEITKLLQEILYAPPDLERLLEMPVKQREIREKLAAIVGRLLEKSPDDRYASAEDVIKDLNAAAGNPPRQESLAIRESFLESARFIGRSAEMDQLSNALKQVAEGAGSAWLIGGESGVGKSRLLDELRAQALVDGVLVLRGQTVSEGGGRYQVWRDALRRLGLQSDLTAFEASVLKPLIPDIASLVDFLVDDAPLLEPQANQERLLTVIESIFARQQQPIMLIFEDLHWGGSESMAVINHITYRIHNLKLMLVGSYRDDECPNLPRELPDLQVLKLHRLNKEHIAELSESMLGKAGQNPRIVELLQKETEGNAFFLVEVVRALAQEAGQLDKVGSMKLPETVFAGGIQQVIHRRLERVPPVARPLLQLAAMSGRELDLALLATLEPGMNLSEWLVWCSDAAVIDVFDGKWRFAHDKLREGLLMNVPSDRRQVLHRQLAEAIETLYADAPEHAASLAHHWRIVGNTEKEMHYALIVGEQKLTNSAYQEAIQHLNHALSLPSANRLSNMQRATVERQLGEAFYSTGQFDDSRQHLERAASLMGYPVPTTPPRFVLWLLGNLGRQVLHRYIPSLRRLVSPEQRKIIREYCRIALKLQYLYGYVNSLFVQAIYFTFKGLNTGEKAGPSPELIQFYAAAAYSFGSLKLHKLGTFYEKLAFSAAKQVTDQVALGAMYSLIGLYRLAFGKWTESEEFNQKALDIFQKIGDQRRWEEVMNQRVFVAYMSGRYQWCIDCAVQITASALKRNDAQAACTGLLPQIMSLSRLGRNQQAKPLLAQLHTLLKQDVGKTTSLWGYSVIAVIALQKHDYKAAREAADTALKIVMKSAAIAYLALEAYSSLVEVYLSLWKHTQNDSERTTLHHNVKLALKTMKSFSGFQPIGTPRSLLWQGMYQLLMDDRTKAIATLQNCLRESVQFDVADEQALVNYLIGCFLPADDPARMEHYRQSEKLFEQMGSQNRLYQLRDIATIE